MVCSDLRLKSHHIVNTFEGSNSVGWIKLLQSHPYSLLTDNFAGEVGLLCFLFDVEFLCFHFYF